MISFITGKPGGGKGLLSMSQIIDELVKGTRNVICNTPVRLQPWIFGDGSPMIGLKAYLVQKYGKDFDCEKRVYLLDDEQAACFFLWRVVDDKLVKSESEIKTSKDNEERVLSFETVNHSQSGPVLYVIDEAWKFFSARSWQKTGEAALFYAAQHRHFGDDVLIVTQHTKQIDPAFQRVAQDFWVVKNHSKLSIGMFRQPDIFSVAIFDQAPTGAQMDPMSRKVFRLDKKGICQTYDTSAGVGLSGRFAADTGSRRKGIPWWGMIVVLVLIIICVSELPKIMGLLFGHSLKKVVPEQKTVQPAKEKTVPEKSVQHLADFQSLDVQPLVVKFPGDSLEDTNDVVCIGYAAFGKDAQAFFSDGTIAYSDAGELTLIEKHWVTAWGRRYRVIVGRAVSPAPLDVRSPNENQGQSPESDAYISQSRDPLPVNQVTILPPIHSQVDGMPKTPRINGFSSMQQGQSQQFLGQ